MVSRDKDGVEIEGLEFWRLEEEDFVVEVEDLDISVWGRRWEGSHCRHVSFCTPRSGSYQLTLIFFLLHSSQAFMILIRWACSLCSLVLVPRPAEEVTSTPSLVMIEKPGSLTSAAFFVSFRGFFETRALRARLGGVIVMEPYPESPNIAEEVGEGV